MNCRICNAGLETVLDLGEQCLGGQFPKLGEPDPPKFPLVLSRCGACGLLQLRDTVDPTMMYSDYWYRSGVTQTMRSHLFDIATEAREILGRGPESVLDIGCNDGTLLSLFDRSTCIGIDPSNVHIDPSNMQTTDDIERIVGFYPNRELSGDKFDLIFSIACFYDVTDPVAFARAIRENLTDDGIWCCELSDANAVIGRTMYDSICHEHLCYYSPNTFRNVMARAGLQVIRQSTNSSNGGSIRFYVKRDMRAHTHPWTDRADDVDINHFVQQVQQSRDSLIRLLRYHARERTCVHLLGASTKANTLLQYCGITTELVHCASDRDQRKFGRCTPGSRIPILSEDDSRGMWPDVYLIGPYHFRSELIARESKFLDSGGTLLFPLPKLEEVKR